MSTVNQYAAYIAYVQFCDVNRLDPLPYSAWVLTR
jgi:hypothetical protein